MPHNLSGTIRISFILLIVLIADFAVAQKGLKTAELFIKGDAIHVDYYESKVWASDHELVFIDKTSKKEMRILPFQFDRFFLNNQPVISYKNKDKDIFLIQLIASGKIKLYVNRDTDNTDHFYILHENGTLEQIPLRNVKQYLISNFYDHDYRTNDLIDNLIYPERAIYLAENFKNIFYSYNESELEGFSQSEERKIKYKPYGGIEIGAITNGVSLGVFTQIPISRHFRFDTELVYSSYKANSFVTFGAFNSHEAEASISEIALPLSLRLVPGKGANYFSLQSGIIPRYSSFKFGKLSVASPPETTTSELNVNFFLGSGYNHKLSYKKSIGVDVRYIFSKFDNLLQLMLRMSL